MVNNNPISPYSSNNNNYHPPEPSYYNENKLTPRNIKNKVKGNFNSFLSLPDKYPVMAIVFDIGIIALGIIAITSVILMSGGGGLMLFSLIPIVCLTGLGGALLLSDIIKSAKAQVVIKKIMALSLPWLLFTASGILLATAAIAGSGGILMVTSPLFLMGLILFGSALASFKGIGVIFSNNNKTLTSQNKPNHLIDNQPANNNSSIKENHLEIRKNKRKISKDRTEQTRNKNIDKTIRKRAIKTLNTKKNINTSKKRNIQKGAHPSQKYIENGVLKIEKTRRKHLNRKKPNR